MALKVLSGILITRGHNSGNADIKFSDHTVTGNNFTLNDRQQLEFGPNTPFGDTPCKIVAMRELNVKDGSTLRINDSAIDKNHLEITWNSSDDGSEIQEISYMVVGNA